jgi:dTDP-4-dehydrorhamnose reductase
MWVILGKNGQLGKAFAKILEENKIEFTSFSSRDLDVRELNTALSLVKKLHPAVVINTTGWTQVDEAEFNQDAAYAVNAFGAQNLAVASKSVSAIFVHFSSDYVFPGNVNLALKEDDPISPLSVYGKSKALGENLILETYPEKSYIFRTAWLYSEFNRNFAKTMVEKALFSNEKVSIVDDQHGQPTSALSVARQVVKSINYEIEFGIYHATNSGQATWFDFTEKIFQLLSADKSRLQRISSFQLSLPAKRPMYSYFNHEKWDRLSLQGKPVMKMAPWDHELSLSLPSIARVVKSERN